MTLTLVHTADWQIGRPFGQFDERRRTLLREARLTVVDRIAEVAIARGAGHVLVAGDVFDSPTVADQLLRQTLARLAKYSRLTWHLLPGNHDPLRAGGVWDRIARIGVPANVVVHSEAAPVPLGSAAMLLPAPLTSSASGRDPTAWMDDAMTPPGVSRIGLAHGSVRGFGSEAHASQQIAPSRAQTAGLAYLALGDWHGALSVSDRVWYSGTPEPDRYPENEPGYVIVVQIGDGGDTREPPVKVERVRVAHFVWSEQHAVLEQASDWDRIAAGITDGATAGVPADRQLLKLVLSGAVTLTERTRIEAGIAQIEPAYFHFETNLDALHERSDDDDLCGLSDSGARDIAARLRGMIAARDGKDAASGEVAPGASLGASAGVARHALRKLMRLDAQLACGPADGRDAREAP